MNYGCGLWESLAWEPNSIQLEQMICLQTLLTEWNQKVNLTRLLQKEEYWIGQIYDSLWPFTEELKNPLSEFRCIDVGSGCGFPGFAIAIALPKSNFTLIDSTLRKTLVLEKISKELGLESRLTVRNERAELTGQNQNYRGTFDRAMARAVAPAPIVAEYLMPLLNQTGEAIVFRGHWTHLDEAQLSKALKVLQGDVIKTEKKDLPLNLGIRHQIRLKAKSMCPRKYPRDIGVPSRRPLGG